jgi:hypothetical protein
LIFQRAKLIQQFILSRKFAGGDEGIAEISDSKSSITNNKSTQSDADVSPIIEANFEEIL